MNYTTSEVLDLAADYIRDHGWVKGTGWDYFEGGPVCLEGAIAAVMEIPALASSMRLLGRPMMDAHRLRQCDAYQAVREFVGGKPYEFNDASDVTMEDVIAVLRATAMVEYARENSVYSTEDEPLPVEIDAA